jgi:hypothetical protein
MDYVVIAKERARFQQPSPWQVSRWVDGQGRFLGRDLSHEDAVALAQREAGGLPVRNWTDCIVCGGDWPQAFMVHKSVWNEAKLGRGIIHIGCLETLLGRKLTAEDFDFSIPVNEVLAFGLQMGRER